MSTKTNIKPSDIRADGRIAGAFDDQGGWSRAMEKAAAWVVRFCQARNGNTWQPFLLKDIDQYHAEVTRGRHGAFSFNGLAMAGLIMVGGQGRCTVTEEFITRCYRAAPA